MNLLITGGCGFIGSNFVRWIHTAYPAATIYNLDLLTYAGNPANLRGLEGDPRYVFIKGDVADRALLGKIFEENSFDAIFHFAAESHVDRSIVDSQDFVRTNIQGTHALLDAMRVHRTPRMIHISTDEVYGDRRGQHGADEGTVLNPSSPYSASKAGADFLCQAYIRTYKLPVIIIRGCNNFGPYQYPEKLVSLAITNLIENTLVPVHGSGDHTRMWIFVEDFCHAIDTIWQRGRPGEIFNVGGGEYSNLDVLRAIHASMGITDGLRVRYVMDREGQDTRYAIQWEKIRRELGWDHTHDFSIGIKKTVEWYEAHPAWWQSIKQTVAFKKHYERQARDTGPGLTISL